VENIHQEKSLDKPDRFDVFPPVLDEHLWSGCLLSKGYSLSTAIFFSAPAIEYVLPSEFKLIIPSQDEYLEWFYHLVRSLGHFEEKWFEKIKPLQSNFYRIFKPYWLLKGSDLAGWVYYAGWETTPVCLKLKLWLETVVREWVCYFASHKG